MILSSAKAAFAQVGRLLPGESRARTGFLQERDRIRRC
jgi:hypothetical protein